MNRRMRRTFFRLVVGMLLLLLLPACRHLSPEEEAELAFVEQHRKQKDMLFKTDAKSPLLPEDKASFTGLHYYPVDISFRFEGPIIKYDSVMIDTIRATGGDLRPALKYGYFDFVYQQQRYRLQIYKMLREEPELQHLLFLGFTDETNGKETYGGGRYIDLAENEENYYVVDFNLAYNPYCAYNPAYTCAIPPPENHLPFPVTAGEKLFKKHE